MNRPIIHDAMFLAQPAEPAAKADLPVIVDLMDTLKANAEECVGMAANMIGVRKAIIVVSTTFGQLVMCNPKIVKQNGAFETEEGCLSLSGRRKTKRYTEIEVEYQDAAFRKRKGRYVGKTAQIIQHEIDHCRGILI